MDTKTKDFLKKVELLVSKGVVKNRQAIIDDLAWNKSVMSSVRNGNMPVPQHVYSKFKEVYAEALQQIEAENNNNTGDDYKEKYIAILEKQLTEKDHQIELKNNHIAELTAKYAVIEERLNSTLLELQKQAVINRSFLKTALLVLGRVVANQEKKTPEKIHSEISKLLGEVQVGAS